MNTLIRKLLVLAGMTIALGVAILPSATPTQAAPSNTFIGAYRIVPLRNSVVALDAVGCSASAGTRIQLWNYWGGDCQQWYIQATGSGYYKITSKNGGRALDAMGCSPNAGTPVHLWDYWGGDCQQWSIEATDWNSRRYKITSKNGGRALDMTGCSPYSGTPIQLWNYWGGDCQQWLILPVTPPITRYYAPLSVGTCTLYVDRIEFYIDGRGSFLSRALSSRAGEVMQVSIKARDQVGSTLFTVGPWQSPPLQATNPNSTYPGAPFNVQFTYDPAFFSRIAGASLPTTC